MSDNAKPEFELTVEQKSRLVPNIDVDALERFLQIAGQSDEVRIALLQHFSKHEPPSPSSSLDGVIRGSWSQIVGVVGGDPHITTLLDEIWAPTWESWGMEVIEHSESNVPGRELARSRLMAKMRSS